jgi:septal ring factor EnvC (AmiA/AmiB activator)
MRVGLLAVLVLAGSLLVMATIVHAEECDNPGNLNDTQVISGCISKYSGILDAIAKANTNNKQELLGLQSQVVRLQGQIKALDGQLIKLSGDIFDREVKIGVKQEMLAAKVRQDYIRKKDQPMLLVLFAADTAADFFRDISYREKLAMQDRATIEAVTAEVKDLNDQTAKLKSQKESLGSLKDRVDKQALWLQGEVDKASKYEADLFPSITII